MISSAFLKGVKDSVPIGFGYFAVSFSLGIIAVKASLSPLAGFTSSFLTRASAGEYGVYSLILSQAGLIDIFLISVIANIRYLLMGASLSQKLNPLMPMWKRIVTGACITDEIFGISIAYPGYLPMSYPLGATLFAGTFWGLGTACGIMAGNMLPVNILSALSVALYGMFIAVIVPPCRRDRILMIAVIVSFISSGATSLFLKFLNSGTRVILLTIVISVVFAFIKPVKDGK